MAYPSIIAVGQPIIIIVSTFAVLSLLRRDGLSLFAATGTCY